MVIEEKIDLIREAMWRLNELWPVLRSPSTEEHHHALCSAMARLSRVSMALEQELREIEDAEDAEDAGYEENAQSVQVFAEHGTMLLSWSTPRPVELSLASAAGMVAINGNPPLVLPLRIVVS